MFGFFKKNVSKNPIELVATHLRIMGYDFTAYGAGVALLEYESGYNEVETASHIALTTMALDIREAGDDIVQLTRFVPHAMALLDVLNSYKNKSMINPRQCQSDVATLVGICTVDSEQENWIERVLSDPIAGKQRLATSRLNYDDNS